MISISSFFETGTCSTTGIRYFERLCSLYALVSLVTQLKGTHVNSFIMVTIQVLFSRIILTSEAASHLTPSFISCYSVFPLLHFPLQTTNSVISKQPPCNNNASHKSLKVTKQFYQRCPIAIFTQNSKNASLLTGCHCHLPFTSYITSLYSLWLFFYLPIYYCIPP